MHLFTEAFSCLYSSVTHYKTTVRDWTNCQPISSHFNCNKIHTCVSVSSADWHLPRSSCNSEENGLITFVSFPFFDSQFYQLEEGWRVNLVYILKTAVKGAKQTISIFYLNSSRISHGLWLCEKIYMKSKCQNTLKKARRQQKFWLFWLICIFCQINLIHQKQKKSEIVQLWLSF